MIVVSCHEHDRLIIERLSGKINKLTSLYLLYVRLALIEFAIRYVFLIIHILLSAIIVLNVMLLKISIVIIFRFGHCHYPNRHHHVQGKNN